MERTKFVVFGVIEFRLVRLIEEASGQLEVKSYNTCNHVMITLYVTAILTFTSFAIAFIYETESSSI
jgi:hypothetical protein